MKEPKIYYADCETTGLLHQLVEQGEDAKLHNFCAMSVDTDKIYLLHDAVKLKKFLDRDIVLVMHNGICYDNNALIHFGFNTSKVHYVDTLALSWYLDLTRSKHGLESYGEEAGVPKPVINDWEKLTQKDYDNRVIEDVKIQRYTYKKLKRMFEELYGDLTDYEFCTHRVVKYLNFKMKQLSEQQNTGFKINIEKAKGHIQEYSTLIDEKTEQLASVMPKVAKYTLAKPPSKPYKADGSLSATGLKWKGITESVGVNMDFNEPIKVLKCYEEPNPSSPQQLKDWLFGLGWIPQTYKFDKDVDGNEKKIPQIYLPQSGGQICPSIERLAEDVPEVNALIGLGVVKHRKGAIQGFIDSLIHNEYIEAGANGFTNTLRLKHRKPFCNLPSSRVPYGLDVRGCLVARDHKVLGGADLSSLENRIKFNLQLPYDRDYVLSQMSDDFDPHLDIACEGGLVTQDQVNFYKIVKEGFEESRYEMTEGLLKLLGLSDEDKEAEIKAISKARGKGKNTNYGCLPMDTKILTKQGLKFFNEVRVGDVVYSYKDGKLVEDVIKYKHFYKDAEVGEFGDSKKSLRCTLNHRWITQKRVWNNSTRRSSKVLCDVEFKECQDLNSESKILTTAPYVGGNSLVSKEQARLLGWILSDGSFGRSVTIAQSKNKFYEDVEKTIESCNVRYTKSVSLRDNGNDVFIYTLKKSDIAEVFNVFKLNMTKDQDLTKFILSLSKEALDSFVESFYLGDGGVKDGKSYTIRQNAGYVLEAVHLALFLQGDGRVVVEGNQKCKIIRKHKSKHISCQRKTWKKIYTEDVFCLTTGNGSFVIVQDNEMMITGNCQYGAGASTVARTAGVPLSVGKALVGAYKSLNWSIEKIASSQTVKNTSHGTYQLNPFNGIWYHLKTDKDRFSTLVQGTGSYILDLWLSYEFKIREQEGLDLKLLATAHDEQIIEFDSGLEDQVKVIIARALDKVNERLNLEIKFGCDIQFGTAYSDIH